MTVSPDDVKRVAKLALLSLTSGEQLELSAQLTRIVELVAELSELDTDGIEPLVHAIELNNVLGEDRCQPSLPREEVLRNAPAEDGECFRVPAVLG